MIPSLWWATSNYMWFFFPAEGTDTCRKKILKVIYCLTDTVENYCHKQSHADTVKCVYASQTEHFTMNPSAPTCSSLLKSPHTYVSGSSLHSHSPLPSFPHLHFFLSSFSTVWRKGPFSCLSELDLLLDSSPFTPGWSSIHLPFIRVFSGYLYHTIKLDF